MALLKQSTAYVRTFFLVQSADHLSALTGATPTVNISKAGAAFGAAAGAVAEIGNGWYKCSLTTADTGTLGDLAFHVTATSADDTDFVDQVIAFDLGTALSSQTVGTVTSVTNGVTVTTNNDKTGYSLTQTFPTNFSSFSIDASGRVDVAKVAGTAQTARDLGAQLDATVSSRLAPTVAGRTLDVTTTGEAGIDWANVGAPTTTVNLSGTTISAVSGAVGSVTGAVGSVTAGVTVTTNNDKTGYGLSAAAVQAIWDALTSALTTVGSIGKRLADFITGDAYARLGAPAGASVSADIAAVKSDSAAIKLQTDSLAFTSGKVNAHVITTAVDAIDAGSLATSGVQEIADTLLDRADAVETGLTPRGALRLTMAALAGKASGLAGTTATFRNAVADTKARITATVDVDGNRTAVTTDTT